MPEIINQPLLHFYGKATSRVGRTPLHLVIIIKVIVLIVVGVRFIIVYNGRRGQDPVIAHFISWLGMQQINAFFRVFPPHSLRLRGAMRLGGT